MMDLYAASEPCAFKIAKEDDVWVVFIRPEALMSRSSMIRPVSLSGRQSYQINQPPLECLR